MTTRRREVSLGYGWLLRGVFGVLAIAGGAILARATSHAVAACAPRSIGVALAASFALGVSVVRRAAGVRGREALRAERKARVAAMVGTRPTAADDGAVEDAPVGPEFPPALDLVAPIVALRRTARGVRVRGRTGTRSPPPGSSSARRSSAR